MNSRLTHTRPADRDRRGQVGFSQRIKLEWMEITANMVLAGMDRSSIESALRELLKDKLSIGGNAKRGNREKVITILMKIWAHPPRLLHPLQEGGLKLLSHLPHEEHIAVHWGMAMAVYPFWCYVAAHVGRLLRLQGKASHAQVRRRIMEQYGQRPTIKDAVRRILRSMVDWGVLKDTKSQDTKRAEGVYVQGPTLTITQVEAVAWLVEAYLYTQPSNSASLRTVLDSPGLFPFHLEPVSASYLVATSGRLDVLRHGLDEDLIILRHEILPTAGVTAS